MSGMPEIAKRVAESMSQITQVLTAAEKAAKRTTKVVQDSIANTRKATTAATAQATAVSNQVKHTKEVTRVLDSFNISLLNFEGNLSKTHKATSLMIAKMLPGAIIMERLGLSTAGASDQAKKLSAAQIAQGGALAILGTIISAVFQAFGRGVNTMRTFTGGISSANYSLADATALMTSMGVRGAYMSVSMDELDKAMASLISSYSIQTKTLRMSDKATKAYVATAGMSVTAALGYGKAVGMSADETTKLINSMILMGEPLETIDRSFGALYTNARQAGVNIADFAKALETLAPSSVFVRNATATTTSHMKQLASALIGTNTPLFQIPGRLNLTANALQEIAKVSAQMDVPALLAFGSTMGVRPGNLTERLDEALKTDRITILERYTDKITASVKSSGAQTFAVFSLLQQMGIKDTNLARSASEMLIKRSEAQHKGDLSSQKDIEDQLKKLDKRMVESLAQDPMEKLIQYAQNQLVQLTQIVGIMQKFSGERGGISGMPMTNMTPLPEMFSTRPKTGRAGRP